jgi:protein-disulfide isomerase
VELNSSETPVAKPESPYANPSAVLVIPRVVFNYVIIAIVFFALGTGITYLAMNNLFNANSAENNALVDKTVKAVLADIGTNNANTADAQQPGLDPNKRYDVAIKDQPSWGAADAPITIVEFSDFQCPFCERFFNETYPQLKQKYGDKIHFVYRDFPLSQIHPQADIAAQAANCANAEGKFWEYHDILFKNQSKLQRDDLVGYAAQLGIDKTKFGKCLDSRTYDPQINQDIQDGFNLGVGGTPTFFINGRPVVGAQPYAVFAQTIDAELNQAAQATEQPKQ